MGDAPPILAVEVLDAPAAAFRIDQQTEALGPGQWQVEIGVELTGDQPRDAAVRVSAELSSAHPHFLVPGAFYGENRPRDNQRVFPRFAIGASGSADHTRMVSDEWHLRADRCATPAVFVWPDDGAAGLALITDERSELGPQSVGFSARDGRAVVSVTVPAREYPGSYYGDGELRPASLILHHFRPGERSVVRVLVHTLSADRHDYDRVLRDLHRREADRWPVAPWVDHEEAAAIAADGLVRWHFDPDPGVLLETVGFDREITGHDGEFVDRQAMHVGWVSGIPWAFALLQHADRTQDERAAAAAEAVIDFCTAELSPSGTFWGVWYREGGWTQSWTHHRRGLHARTLGEATDFLIRALAFRDRPRWREAALSNLEAIVARQRDDGNLGSIHHAETGEVLSWDGSAPLAWVPALLSAAAWDERFATAAIRAGDYYARFVEAEHLHGAPEDVDLAPTSEDGYVAVMAYTALYRHSGEERWLSLARRAAEWTFTFRYGYNVAFPERTLLGRYDFRTRGADQASSSNQHLHAYGLICTKELLELSELTGDEWYRLRAEETLDCFRQLLAREDGELNAYRGMITERYYQTDCFQPKGMVLTLSHAWSAGVLLLGCEQWIARQESVATADGVRRWPTGLASAGSGTT